MTTYVKIILTIWLIFDGRQIPLASKNFTIIWSCYSVYGFKWISSSLRSPILDLLILWNNFFSFQLQILIVYDNNYLVTQVVRCIWWCMYSLRHAHKADILRDRSLHCNLKKKKTVSVHAPELSFCIMLNHLIGILNTYHIKLHCYHDTHTARSGWGYVRNMNPKHA